MKGPSFIRCEYKITVPANVQLLAKLNTYLVDCPADFVTMGVQGRAPLITLCPAPTSSKIYAMNPVPNGKRDSSLVTAGLHLSHKPGVSIHKIRSIQLHQMISLNRFKKAIIK